MKSFCRMQFLGKQLDKLGSKIKNLIWAGFVTFGFTFVICGPVANAQQPTKVWRIAWVSGAPSSSIDDRIATFRQGLRDLGYVEGKDIIVEVRSAEGKRDRLPAIMTELLRLNVDVIVSAGAGTTRLAKAATSTIPIIMAQDPDPVANGFVASLARPGGNITGLATYGPELSGKRLEILKETVSNLKHVAVFGSSNTPGYTVELKEVERAASALKVELQSIDIRAHKDFGSAFDNAIKGRAQAVLWQVSGTVYSGQQKTILTLVTKSKLPVIYEGPGFVRRGGLMSYGVDLLDLSRRAAVFVDKIIKGRAAADLPVEQPIKFDFVVNLKAAKDIGLTIPPNVLVRATRVIK